VAQQKGGEESRRFALAAAELAATTRCENVVLLDLRSRSPVTEYFVIATGTSPRQMRTVVDELRDLGKRTGFAPWQMDGYDSAKWIVLDCVNVVVHVFDTDSRDFYDLELLWGDCPRIDWRKELGLPPAPAEEAERAARRRDGGGVEQDRFEADQMDAEEEDARLDGRDLDEEEGDNDIDEDAETDAPVVMELPDLSSGSNSVEFVEIDPPDKRRQRGRAVYPTPIGDVDEEEEAEDQRFGGKTRGKAGGVDLSTDEDDQERDVEAARDADPEAVSAEDMPEDRVESRPMGGVSASMSSTSILDENEEDQLGNRSADDAEQDHKDESPEAHERAAEAIQVGNVNLTTEQPGDMPRKKALKTRRDMAKPVQAAPGPVNVEKAKAGVVKGPARRGAESGVVDAPDTARGKKPVVKMSTRAPAKKAARGGGRAASPKKVKAAAPKKATKAGDKPAGKTAAKGAAKGPAKGPAKGAAKAASKAKVPAKKAASKAKAPARGAAKKSAGKTAGKPAAKGKARKK
jgi:ribosome-associated protein